MTSEFIKLGVKSDSHKVCKCGIRRSIEIKDEDCPICEDKEAKKRMELREYIKKEYFKSKHGN